MNGPEYYSYGCYSHVECHARNDVVLADSGLDVADSVGLMGASLDIPAFTKGLGYCMAFRTYIPICHVATPSANYVTMHLWAANSSTMSRRPPQSQLHQRYRVVNSHGSW